MAATTLPTLTLRNVRLTLNTGDTTSWVDLAEIAIKWTLGFDDRTAGASLVEQLVSSTHASSITLKGWNAASMSFGADAIQPGTRITALTLLDTATSPASALGSTYFSKFPVSGFMFGDLETAFNGKPSQFMTVLRANVLA